MSSPKEAGQYEDDAAPPGEGELVASGNDSAADTPSAAPDFGGAAAQIAYNGEAAAQSTDHDSNAADKGTHEQHDQTENEAGGAHHSKEGSEEPGAKRQRKRKSGWDTTPTEVPAVPPGVLGLVADPAAAAAAAAAMAQAQQRQQALQALIMKQQLQAAETAKQQQSQQSMTCRIYVGSIYYDLTEADIIMAFSPFGSVVKIDMPKDSATGKHKGFCFLEYANADAASLAIATMDGMVLAGRKIKVNRPNNVAGVIPSTGVAVNPAMQTAALQNSAALAALLKGPGAQMGMPGMLGAGMSTALMPGGGLPGAQAAVSVQALFQQQQQQQKNENPSARIYVGSIFYDISDEDVKKIFSSFGTVKSCQMVPNPETGKHKGYGFVDFENVESAKNAIEQMNGFELAGRQLKVGWAASTGMMGSAPATGPSHAPAQPPSRCMLLINMVEPEGVDDELEEEVKEECGKHGAIERVVIHMATDATGKQFVKIFVLFVDTRGAATGVQALQGRWFGGKKIQASLYDEARFQRADYSG
eukprot:jgi/Mesvir1/13175/Mv06138-RA.1